VSSFRTDTQQSTSAVLNIFLSTYPLISLSVSYVVNGNLILIVYYQNDKIKQTLFSLCIDRVASRVVKSV
jgi:hypothetical protein